MDYILPLCGLIFAAVVFVLIGLKISRERRQTENDCNTSPVTVDAVVTLRYAEMRSNHKGPGVNPDSSAWNRSGFVTFKTADGKKREFQLKAKDYDLILEGDKGKLTHQGSTFISFERER